MKAVDFHFNIDKKRVSFEGNKIFIDDGAIITDIETLREIIRIYELLLPETKPEVEERKEVSDGKDVMHERNPHNGITTTAQKLAYSKYLFEYETEPPHCKYENVIVGDDFFRYRLKKYNGNWQEYEYRWANYPDTNWITEYRNGKIHMSHTYNEIALSNWEKHKAGYFQVKEVIEL